MVDMRERLNEIDGVIDARLESYAAIFQSEVDRFVAENGLVPGGANPEASSCTANYYPTQPQNTTKSYDLELSVYINGMGVSQGAIHRPLEETRIRVPTADEIDRALIRSATTQNRRVAQMLDARSSYCAIARGQTNNNRLRFIPCTHAYKYVLRLMSDTYISDQGDEVRGYWLIDELDPDHPSLTSGSAANAYGNSLGRPVLFYDESEPAGPDDTHAVRCRDFDYIGPWRGDDRAQIDQLLSEMETNGWPYRGRRVAPSHRRTGYNDLLFEQIWHPGE